MCLSWVGPEVCLVQQFVPERSWRHAQTCCFCNVHKFSVLRHNLWLTFWMFSKFWISFRYSWKGQFYQLGWGSASQRAFMLIQAGRGQGCGTASVSQRHAGFVNCSGCHEVFHWGFAHLNRLGRNIESAERQKPKYWLTKSNIIYNTYLAYTLLVGHRIHDWIYNNSLKTWGIWAGVNFSLGK